MKTIDNYINEKLNLSVHKYTCEPKNVIELAEILNKRIKKNEDADLNDIDISNLTDMRWAFSGLDPHNIDISEWDMSNITMTSGMFYGCRNFNCDLSGWDVSNVKDMRYMFEGCEKFNCDLSDWDVSNVKDMHNIFKECTSLKNKPSWYE